MLASGGMPRFFFAVSALTRKSRMSLFFVLVAVVAADGAEGPVEWSDPAPLADESLLLDAAQVGGRVVVVGERGHVLVSDDEGGTWEQKRVPTRSMLTAVTVAGEAVWAVGHDAVVVRSADRGETWERQHFAPELESPLFDVWFENGTRGLAIGAYGLALATGDGGATWERREVDPQERHLNDLVEGTDGTLYVAAEYGGVFRSVDRGETWEIRNTPYSGSFFGALALPDGSALVFGLRGHVFRTRDQGGSWEPVETGTDATLLGGAVLPDGSVGIVGLGGAVLRSREGNPGFSVRKRPDRLGLADALPLSKGRWVLVGEGGVRVDAVPEAAPADGGGGRTR